MFLLLQTAFVLSGCAQTSQEPEKVEETVETPTPSPTPTETPTSTPTPTPAQETESTETSHPDEVEVNLESGDWKLVDLKDPDVQIAVPTIVNDWEQIVGDGEHSYDFDGPNFVHLRVDAYITGEPEPEYPEEYVKMFDNEIAETIDWSYKDHLFIKYSHNKSKDLDLLYAAYYPGNCEMTCSFSLPPEETEKYKPYFDAMVRFMTEEAVANTDSHMTEDEIVEKVKKKVGSPLAEIDQYDDDGKFTIHCYENVNNGDEYHTATWAWIVVDPNNRTAYDDITMEPVDGIFD